MPLLARLSLECESGSRWTGNMRPLSDSIRKRLRAAAAEAYRRELDRALEPLHAAFEQWRRGELSGFDLSDTIHRFHQGANRELYLRYTDGDSLFAVAGAIHARIMRLDELHPDLLPVMEPVLETIKLLGSGE